MSVAHTNGKNTLSVVISAVVAAFLVIGAIGGMALAPLYIAVNANSHSLGDLKADLHAHVTLPSHPVMEARVNVEIKRLDDQIKSERDTVEKLWADNKRLETLIETEKASTGNKFVETETQIDSMAQSLNIQFSEGQRRTSDIQHALHQLGAIYPEPPVAPWFFPNISNRSDTKK